jgi:hypothetical protein
MAGYLACASTKVDHAKVRILDPKLPPRRFGKKKTKERGQNFNVSWQGKKKRSPLNHMVTCGELPLLMMDSPKPVDVDVAWGMTGREKCRMRDIVDRKVTGELEDRDFVCMNRLP